MQRVTVVIYNCPETTPIPLDVRAGWLRQLYPHITIIEAWDGPTEVGDTDEIKRKHEHYLIHTLGISGITHFYSSEWYGEHISQAFGAINRQVDPQRQRYPISGTRIRQDPIAHQHYLDPLVYRDVIAWHTRTS